MSDEGVTIALPACDGSCPPLVEWPMVALVKGSCPKCGHGGGVDARALGRAIRAKQLLRERGEE